MRILAVDDEALMLDALTESIQIAAPQAEIHAFRHSQEALQFAQQNPIDIAFLDIQMRGMNGMVLGEKLIELYPKINLIFCTGFDDYLPDAFRRLRCSGYITKPVDAAQIENELRHLRVPLEQEVSRRVKFQCMGRFEAFVDDAPIQFESSKTKELLAFLVHACGGVCHNQEIIASLWEDDNRHDSYYKKIRKDLIVTLTRYGCRDIVIQHRGGMAIDTGLVDCDYYSWKKKHPGVKPDEYMTQFYWANIPYYEW